MRLDKLLVLKNLVDSRSKACMMIQNGDVSFISSNLILPRLTKISPPSLEGVLLWKLQYEVDPKKHIMALYKIPLLSWKLYVIFISTFGLRNDPY
jgi:predicted rRNA methylase YqxC with S4 and FtsJ domains